MITIAVPLLQKDFILINHWNEYLIKAHAAFYAGGQDIVCDVANSWPLAMDCGERLIRLTYSNFGRTKPYAVVCPHPRGTVEDVACTSSIADQLVHCNGLRRCQVDVNLYNDPCLGTGKYAEVQYTCLGE